MQPVNYLKMVSKYSALIFDFDGVILDSVSIKTEAFAELYLQYGKIIQNKVVQYHLKHGGISRYNKIKYFHSEFLGNRNLSGSIREFSE